MEYSDSNLIPQLESLSERRERLGLDLVQAGEDLRTTGAPPATRPLEEATLYRQDFAVLRIKALEYADQAVPDHGFMLDGVTTLDDLRLLIEAAAAADTQTKEKEQIRRHALAVVAEVESVTHRGASPFQPLEDRKAEAHQLRRLLEGADSGSLPPEAAELADGRHPLATFITFIRDRETLDDDDWASLQEKVEGAFGKPLAIAVARGKIAYTGEAAGDNSSAVGSESLSRFLGYPYQGHAVTGAAETSLAATDTPPAEEVMTKTLESAEVIPTAEPGGDGPAQPTADTTNSPAAADEQQAVSQVDDSAKLRAEDAAGAEEEGDTQGAVAESSEVTMQSPERSGTDGTHGGAGEEAAAIGRDDLDADGSPAGGRVKRVPVYGFQTDWDSSTIASAAKQVSGDERVAALRDLVWRLLHEGRSSLAYHLARALREEGSCAIHCLAPALIRQIIIGPKVRHANGDLAALLRKDFGEFPADYFAGENSDWDHAIRFLVAASAMRPALLAPNTGASTVLRDLRLKEGLDRLYSFCSILADHGDKLQPLDTVSLKSAGDQAEWEAAVDALRSEAEEWYARAPQQHIIYHNATRVWRAWLEPGGLIHSLLQPVRLNKSSQLEWVKDETARLTDDQVKREMDRTDKQIRRHASQDITARATVQLLSHVREALEFARRWSDLQEHKPGPVRGFLQHQAELMRDEVRSRHAGVLAELSTFADRNRSLYVQTALTFCCRAVEDIVALFSADAELAPDEPPTDLLLNADLIRLSSVHLDEGWNVEGELGAPNIIDGALALLERAAWDWSATFEERASGRDHEGTLRVIELLEAAGALAEASEFSRVREDQIFDCRAALRKDAEDTRRLLGDAVAFGLLREQEHNELTAEIARVEHQLPATVRFDEAHSKLRDVRRRLAEKREEEREVVRKRLQGLEGRLRSSPEALERIHAALDKGDVHTANEYIEMTLAGLPLPDPAPQSDAFTAFFPQTLRQIFEFLEQTGAGGFNPVSAVAEIRQYASGNRRSHALGPVELDHVPGSQARQAADLFEAWFTAKRAHMINEPGARTILDNLGLNTTAAAVRKQGRRIWIDVDAETVRDRNRCPVPQYGSTALGRYRVLCVWERPSEEDMLSDVADTTHGRPVLLFYFGRMTEPRRRDLARLCRERRRTFVVVDDALICYLCGVRGSRLRVMFDCALPFTFLEPYTTTAGLVPPEMFYGRERERDSVSDLMGSCFIYGGRQLGKTALLRDAERTFHAPDKGRVALWLDLKSHGIGYDRPVDDLWSLLAGEFKRLGVIPPTVPTHTGVDKLLGHVQAWIEGENGRRILLLLDESDRFLEYDGKEGEAPEGGRGFVRAARLKGLMDRTNRRFKIVFAGLHNVQRTTRLANHPLAHYGEPICIGPLLDNGEWRAARDLVERPLASLGYLFESPDLVTRILSQTNYYPSLIQLYCSHLLRHVTGRAANSFDPRACPPYVITSRHVEEAYLSQDLRKAIRDRFIWTLQLDQRYEVIAYAMAHGTLSDGDEGMVDGFNVDWIKRQALDWWPDGFHEGALESDFQTLLDEMVGLGILRHVSTHRYALRSANIVLLMGTVEEIENALLVSREPPLEYEPATFRSALRSGDTVDPGRRNPLTAGQESELRARANGVSLVFATEAAGLDSLRPFLRSAFGDDYFIDMDGVTSKADFDRKLSRLDTRERGGTTLVFVPATCPWGEAWIEGALERVSRLRSATSFVRVVFVADPSTAWQLTVQPQPAINELTAKGVGYLTLKPWHDAALRQWADDSGLPADKDGRDRLGDATGRWQSIVEEFHRAAQADLPRWERKLDEFINRLSDPAVAYDIAGRFGLNRLEGAQILGDLSALGEATAEELEGIVEGVPVEIVRQCLQWAEVLNLASQVGGGRWRVDPFVGHVLEGSRVLRQHGA